MPVDDDDSHDLWTLSHVEHAAVATKSLANRLSFAVLLKYFGIYGRFPRSLGDLDRGAIGHYREPIRHHGNDTQRSLRAGPNRKRHRAEIRTFFGFRAATVRDARELTDWLRDNAVVESRDREQLARTLELECRQRMLEPPAPDRVDRIVRAAVHAYEERFYQDTWAKLSPLARTRLDELLRPAGDGVDDEDASSRAAINTLRSDPGRAGVNSIREELAKLTTIRDLELPVDLFANTRAAELELYRQRVAVETPWELRQDHDTAVNPVPRVPQCLDRRWLVQRRVWQRSPSDVPH